MGYSSILFVSLVKGFYCSRWAFLIGEESLIMCLVVPLVLLTCRFAVREIFTEAFWTSFLFLFFLSSIVFLSHWLLFFLVSAEICSIIISVYILCFSKGPDKVHSLFLMLICNFGGSLPFLAIACLAMFDVCSFNSLDFLQSSFLFLCFFGMLASKVPLVVFHFWLLKAHVRASGVCSMILASLIIKIGGIGILNYSWIFDSSCKAISFWLVLGRLRLFIFSLFIFRCTDLKNLVAASSILHMRLVAPLFLLNSSISVLGSLLMISGHGLISCYLFYLVRVLYESRHSRRLDNLKMIECFNALVIFYFCAFLLINLGFPPFVLFFSELFSYLSIYLFSRFCLVISLTSFFVSFFYFVFTVGKLIFGTSGNKFYNFGVFGVLCFSAPYLFFCLSLRILI